MLWPVWPQLSPPQNTNHSVQWEGNSTSPSRIRIRMIVEAEEAWKTNSLRATYCGGGVMDWSWSWQKIWLSGPASLSYWHSLCWQTWWESQPTLSCNFTVTSRIIFNLQFPGSPALSQYLGENWTEIWARYLHVAPSEEKGPGWRLLKLIPRSVPSN